MKKYVPKCNFVLNDTDKCICKTSSHGSWKFGYRWNKNDEDKNLYHFIGEHAYRDGDEQCEIASWYY